MRIGKDSNFKISNYNVNRIDNVHSYEYRKIQKV